MPWGNLALRLRRGGQGGQSGGGNGPPAPPDGYEYVTHLGDLVTFNGDYVTKPIGGY